MAEVYSEYFEQNCFLKNKYYVNTFMTTAESLSAFMRSEFYLLSYATCHQGRY